MTTTYTPGDLNDPVSVVRLWLGDIGPDEWLVRDEEILFFLQVCGDDTCGVAETMARRIAVTLATQTGESCSIGDMSYSIDMGAAAAEWGKLADFIAEQCASKKSLTGISFAGVPNGGGNCQPPPIFSVGMFDTEENVHPWDRPLWPEGKRR